MSAIDHAIKYAIDALNIDYQLKPFQEDVIHCYASGKDCFLIAPTGSGKSLTFRLAPHVMDWLKGYRQKDYIDTIIVLIQPLKSLMKEQNKKLNDSKIPTVYMGDENVDWKNVESGNFNIIIASPETAVTDKFLDLLKKLEPKLSVLFIDESHCIHTMGHKNDGKKSPFRKQYGQLGIVRSLCRHVPVVTLTATASIDIRESIVADLSMKDCKFLILDNNRLNIKYSVIEVECDIVKNFSWLVQELRTKKKDMDRILIFCQSKPHCSLLFEYFEGELGDDGYDKSQSTSVDYKDDRTRFFGMYHHGTKEQQKLSAEASFSDPNGSMRILFCTSSFGTGVDVKNCHYCIHYGPVNSVAEYLQQSGRIGRDGKQSFALLLLYKRCFVGAKADDNIKQFSKAKTGCRRQILLQAINNPTTNSLEIKHLCCDLCTEICNCHAEKCLYEKCHIENYIHEANKTSVNRVPKFKVTDIDRELFKHHLTEYASSLLTSEQQQQIVTGSALTCGFGSDIISVLIEEMEYITDIEYLINNVPFFSEDHCEKVFDIHQSLLLEAAEESLHYSYESQWDYSDSDDEFNALMNNMDDILSFEKPKIIMSDSESDGSTQL